MPHPTAADVPRFGRQFFSAAEALTAIGSGFLGGKAAGLLEARDALAERPESLRFAKLEIAVPTLTVIATEVFDTFLSRNRLLPQGSSGEDDRVIAHAFQRAELPSEILGDLWDLIRQVHSPLAVRSSSLLEDALRHPFAGVYATKMIPNNQFDAETRFRKLAEAIKLVYASAFFKEARQYIRAAGRDPDEERMAVILQEVVGRKHGPRYYPDLAGVARSFNFYPTGQSRPEEGVVDLACGLGKTIVDGGRTWTYSPAHPNLPPPVASPEDLLEQTQTEFWAVNMAPPVVFDPLTENEYLVRLGLVEAEADGCLRHLASSYDPQSSRLSPGLRGASPRVLNFAPLLQFGTWPLNDAVKGLLDLFERRTGSAVEIEFAATLGNGDLSSARLGFLQVRPMAVGGERVEVSDEDLRSPLALVGSERAMGNGVSQEIHDVVFAKPAGFAARDTPLIAQEVERLNLDLAEAGRHYLLIGFGRWGSSDPWLGIPVVWSQISGARVIVEAALPNMNVEMSQGAHFFHNLLSFRVAYLSVPLHGTSRIDWEALEALPRLAETPHVCHARLEQPLLLKVDGRTGRAVVMRQGRAEP